MMGRLSPEMTANVRSEHVTVSLARLNAYRRGALRQDGQIAEVLQRRLNGRLSPALISAEHTERTFSDGRPPRDELEAALAIEMALLIR
jgi:hypothetical protein